jgi:hypothetical protein
MAHKAAVAKYRIDYFAHLVGHTLSNSVAFASWEMRRARRSVRSWGYRFWHSPVIDYKRLKKTMKGEGEGGGGDEEVEGEGMKG